MHLRKKIAVLTLATTGAVGAAGAAFAFWTTDGSGAGNAATGTVASLVVNQTSTISGLYPGGPAATLSGNFDNPNAAKVYISSVTGALTSVDQAAGASADKPVCTVDDFTLAGTADVGQEIDPGTGQGSWSGLTVALKNTGANQDNCKNATLNLAYTANP